MNAKKYLLLSLLAVLVAVPAFSQAEEVATSTTTTVATTTTATTTETVAPATSEISGLLAKIKELTALLDSLKVKMGLIAAENSELKLLLKSNLTEGMTDEDIKEIQMLLATDPTLYPSGLTTGYFGPMTKQAISLFQTRNGLEVNGTLDEETVAALETIIEERGLTGKVPLGLLLAPGAKIKFEERIRYRCESEADDDCTKLKVKYKFEQKNGDDEVEIEIESEDEDDDSSKDDDEGKSEDEDSDDEEDDDSDEDGDDEEDGEDESDEDDEDEGDDDDN